MSIEPSVTPCQPWVPIGCCAISPDGAAISGTMLGIAQEILFARTGRQFDQCTITLRPCRRGCFGGNWFDQWNEWGTGWPYPYLFAGRWFNLGCGACGDSCSCSVLHDLKLPYPVSEVNNITIDGESLDPLEDFVILYDHQQLVRIDGGDWPLCNDLSKPDTEVGTWSITLTTGTPVPPLGQVALGELTSELVKACLGGDCRLPRNVQQVVRQGITVTNVDSIELMDSGKLGLFFSDLFIHTYNPKNLTDRARAYGIDVSKPKIQTWP